MRLSRHFVRLLVASLCAAAAMPALAARLELQVGRSYMDSYGTNAAFLEGVCAARPLGGSGLEWSPDVALGWIDGRDVASYRHASYSTRDAIWLVAAGARLRFADTAAWYHPLFFSFQPAFHSGRTQALSSGYEFASTLGWQVRRWSVAIRHLSNGNLHFPNRGETMLLVGIAFGP